MKPEKTTVKLAFPVDADGQQIESLEMRRPTVGDLKAARRQGKGRDEDVEITLFANLCMVPPETIEALDYLTDYSALQDAYAGFAKDADED